MTDTVDQPQNEGFVQQTENDRFKDKFGSWLWGSVALAVIAHIAIFLLWPTMSAADISKETEKLKAVEIPPKVEIPPPPEQIARPATPVVAEANIEKDITLAKTTFEDNPVSTLPTPPTQSSSNARSEFQAFVPSMTVPQVQNTAEVVEALDENYPPLLRDAGVEGTVGVTLWLDKQGDVIRAAVAQSSGHPAMDQAALTVVRNVMELTPAKQHGVPVKVRVTIPVTFKLRF